VTYQELVALEQLTANLADAAKDARMAVVRGVSVAAKMDQLRNIVGGLAGALGIAQKSLDAIDKLSRIAIEWISLGIPDEDAINTRYIVNDMRAGFGLPAVEDS
jgi:hypothetical protein